MQDVRQLQDILTKHQSAGLQRMPLALAAHVAAGHPTQLDVDQRDQLRQGSLISLTPAFVHPIAKRAGDEIGGDERRGKGHGVDKDMPNRRDLSRAVDAC